MTSSQLHISHPSFNLNSTHFVSSNCINISFSSAAAPWNPNKSATTCSFAIDVDDYWNPTSLGITTTSCTASTVFIIIEVHGCGSHDSWAREVNKILDSKVTIIMLRLLSLYHFVTLLLWSIYVTPTNVLVLLSSLLSFVSFVQHCCNKHIRFGVLHFTEWLKCNLMMMTIDFND